MTWCEMVPRETRLWIAVAVLAAVPAALSVTPIPDPVASPELTCKFYELTYEYSKVVQPNLTTVQQRAVWDALQLDSCNTTLPAPPPHTPTDPRRPLPSSPLPATGGIVYVDFVKGSDSASGTSVDDPVKTLGKAQVVARTVAKPPTIVLRGGTHYLDATLALTQADSGLTIQSYPGELATISGASQLSGVTWEPFNVTKGSSATMSAPIPNMNFVYGCTQGTTTPYCTFYGKVDTVEACSDACLAAENCSAYTWHDLNQPPPVASWDGQCYWINVGNSYTQHPETHHVSGTKTVVPPKNIYVVHNVAAPEHIAGLRVNGLRGIRARWPNGDPEYQLFPDGWVSEATWKAPTSFPPATDIVVDSPNRSAEGPCSSSSGYCYYYTGVGGACEGLGYEPPSGYWCAANPPRGSTYSEKVPSGMTVGTSAFDGRKWKAWRPNETVVNAFRQGHWFSYVFLTDTYNGTSNEMTWTVGGFQGGEGCGTAAEWNVENVFEELDYPNEYYYDSVTKDLYYFYNGTGAPPSDLELAATQLQQLVTITGGGSARGETAPHVTDISIRGVQFSDAALSTLAPHGLPSDGGGDWAVARRAAVHISGAERVSVEQCRFERIDGNGVMLSGYTRNATIRGNEFHLIGENGVVSWGYTADYPDANRSVPIPTTQGPDATDGNHPQYSLIDGNFFHEIGHFQKQVSCYFHAQSQLSTLSNNICFNGPRAGVNYNDGMGGGDVLSGNIIFNMVRETQDHGTFNSWDRQPFLVERDGQSTFVPVTREITKNLWINNYNPQEATDNDDGSCWYETHHNVFPFSSGGLKNDFGGHDNHHHNNLYYNSNNCMGVCAQKEGHEDAFYNNTCIIARNSPQYAGFSPGIDGPAYPIMHDNRVYTLDGKATEAGKSIEEWQAQGHDLGTTVGVIPSDDQVLAIARGLLGLP